MKALLGSLAAAACAMMLMGGATPAAAAEPVHWLRSIPLDLAMEAAKAAMDYCRSQGRHPSVGVVGHDGELILLLVDDNATEAGQHALIKKMHMATLLQSSTQGNVDRAEKEGALHPEIGEESEIVGRFNENFLVQGGAVAFKIGGDYLGALGVGGTGPGKDPGSESSCANAGFDKIKDRLK